MGSCTLLGSFNPNMLYHILSSINLKKLHHAWELQS